MIVDNNNKKEEMDVDGSHRKLNNQNVNKNMFMLEINFEVKILAERFGIKSKETSQLNILHEHMNEYLSLSMNEGIFLLNLKNVGKLINSKNILSLNTAQLIDLKIILDANISKYNFYNDISLSTIISVICSVIIGIIYNYVSYNHTKMKGYITND